MGRSLFAPVSALPGLVLSAAGKAALPPSYVGETYAQLLSMTNPNFNVAVAAPIDTFNAEFIQFVNSLVLAENQEAAMRFGCGS